ncbi:hypothetical protein EVAR_99764_1 [Eumeta japonica]|uniref:Uncharacterized protein n=1 Tax=Eumeta variegata TaxID=151549 RepID=A0A4C1SZW3_EUMVA|nr:hypothetical protein EVAR_99764_1 [Eumeta japonica]
MATATLQIEKLAGRKLLNVEIRSQVMELDDLRECIDPGTEVDPKKDVKPSQRKFGLLKDLINTPLDNCPSIEQYVNKIMSKAHKLRNIGFEVGNERLGTHMLAAASGIKHQTSTLILEQNGLAERMNRTLVERANTCYLKQNCKNLLG